MHRVSNEMGIKEVLDKIYKEIVARAGKGFTIEVNSEVTKFNTWKEYGMLAVVKKKRTDIKYVRPSYHENPDISISKKVENELPTGITIKKTLPVVLYDTQNEYFVSNQVYVEGHRVYLTVTDEYASKILSEVYTSECLFRDRLLKKHAHILKDIALRLDLSKPAINKTFEVLYDGIYYAYNDRDGCYFVTKVLFEEFEMDNLSSYTQLYGMALAILEILEKDPDCICSEINCEISINSPSSRMKDGIHVLFGRKVKPEPTQPPKKELKTW